VKLCTFEIRTALGRHQRLGALIDDGQRIADVHFCAAAMFARRGDPRPYTMAEAYAPASMLEFLRTGDRAVSTASEAVTVPGEGPRGETLVHDLKDARLLAPLTDPPSVRDFFAFEEHVRKGFARRGMEIPKEWYEIPVYYQTGHHNLIGTGADLPWPSFTNRLDYELELAAVIGKRGRNIPAAEAMDYIAGFTIMNDFSARDIQRKEMAVMLGPAKAKHWCSAFGPVLVTRDEIGDPYNLRMTARVNGELWSEGNSGTIFHKFERMIEYLTQDDFIQPGDIIGSGTVGTGCGLELDRWLQRGDVVELEIERIGVLHNRIV
jgi:2-keto-4-pentenoate hydratase/2-oxohepta-3-ene-1,7-dioic acid hydratase in catechol pathway